MCVSLFVCLFVNFLVLELLTQLKNIAMSFAGTMNLRKVYQAPPSQTHAIFPPLSDPISGVPESWQLSSPDISL